jgi:predicted Zn-dependent protease
MRRRCSSARVLAWLLALASAGCGPITVTEERRLGYQFEYQMRGQVDFLRDRVVTGYISEMGRELVGAAGPQPFDYHFYVVKDDEINAFAGPAGHIYIHTETILKARNASELAGVIAHEVGHVARRHVAQNYNRQRNAKIGTDMLAAGAGLLAGGAAGGAAQLGGGLAAMTYLNSFGREAEEEADLFAVGVLPEAGYDPGGLVTFFETLQREGGSEAPAFLSSHPATSDRIEATRSSILALGPREGLRSNDGGKFEIIQARVALLTQRPHP